MPLVLSRADLEVPVNTVRQATASALLVLSLAVVVLAALDVTGGVRLLVVVAFGLLAPGWAVVAFWRPANPAMEWATSIAVSAAILVVLSMAMLLTSAWSPVPVAIVLALATAATLAVHLLADRRLAAAGRTAGRAAVAS